jgi:DNA-binding response OmpR family regulator
MKILIIEDNEDLSNNIRDYLEGEGHICTAALTFDEAIDKIISFSYDMLVLDIMLPDGSGLDVIEALHKQDYDAGVLIISAKGSLEDRIKGLDIGADDYLTKPFHLSELNSRLKAIFRRKSFDGYNQIVFNELKIDPDSHEAWVKEQLIDLTQKEFELLLYFLANKNRLITKQSIAEHLWGDYVDLYDSFDFVYQHIKNLRKKILKAGGMDYIDTIYGLGYKFNTQRA